MKTPKTKAATAEPPAVAKHPYGLPSPEQLAHLAATLARRTDDNPTLLAHAALKLWRAAENAHYEATEYYIGPAALAAYKATQPSLPMTRGDFLSIVLPKARPEDRERAWKHYNLAKAGTDPSAATNAEEKAASLQWKSPADLPGYILATIHFQTWWNKYHAAEVSTTRSGIRRQAIAKAKMSRKARPPHEKFRDALLT